MQNDINRNNYLKIANSISPFNFSFVDQIKNLFIMILEKISLNDELKLVLLNSKYDPKILFSQLDFQSKGYIALEDLEYFLKQINYLVTDSQKNIIIRKFIRLYDKKGGFTLSYDDFYYLISPINKKTVFNNNEIINNVNELFYNIILNEFELVELINTEIEKIGKCENYNSYEAFMIIGQGQKYINNDLLSVFINNMYSVNFVDYLIHLIDNNNDKLIDYNEFQDFFVPYNNLKNVKYFYRDNNNQINIDDCKDNLNINYNIKQIKKSKSYDHLIEINNVNINYDYQNNNNYNPNNNVNIKLNNSNGLNNNLNRNLNDPNKSLTYKDFTFANTNNFKNNTNSFLESKTKTTPQDMKSYTTQKFPEVFRTEKNFKFKVYENEDQLYNTTLNDQNSKEINNNYENITPHDKIINYENNLSNNNNVKYENSYPTNKNINYENNFQANNNINNEDDYPNNYNVNYQNNLQFNDNINNENDYPNNNNVNYQNNLQVNDNVNYQNNLTFNDNVNYENNYPDDININYENNLQVNNDNDYKNNFPVNRDIKSKIIEHEQIGKNIGFFTEKAKNNNNIAQSKYIDYNDYIKNKNNPSINGQEEQTDQIIDNNNNNDNIFNLLISYFLEYLQLIIKKESKIQLIKESLCLREDIIPNELFLLFDKKQRGFISINDFKFICKNILYLYPTIDQIKLVYKRYNINKKNKLNKDEFFNMINPLKKEYKEIFYSKKNKNKIDMKLSLKSKNIIIDLIKVLIENESIYYETRKKMRRAGCVWEELINILKEYSKNGNDDGISEDEFNCFLNDVGFLVSNYQSEMLFSFFDRSKEGIIKYKEIVDDLKRM